MNTIYPISPTTYAILHGLFPVEGDLTIEDVREAHRADLANQEKYGVRYLQFWVNEIAGMVFCLITQSLSGATGRISDNCTDFLRQAT